MFLLIMELLCVCRLSAEKHQQNKMLGWREMVDGKVTNNNDKTTTNHYIIYSFVYLNLHYIIKKKLYL